MKYLFRFILGFIILAFYPIVYLMWYIQIFAVFLWHASWARASKFAKKGVFFTHEMEAFGQIQDKTVGQTYDYHKNVFYFMINKTFERKYEKKK